MKQKSSKITDKTKFEISKENNAKDLTWELFKKTGDTKYYRLFSALKEKKENNKFLDGK